MAVNSAKVHQVKAAAWPAFGLTLGDKLALDVIELCRPRDSEFVYRDS
jgi:hypothetical protein